MYVPADFPRGDPFNVGQMYALFPQAIRTGQSRVPTFDTAVDLHRFIDTIKQASENRPGAAGRLRRGRRPWTPGGAIAPRRSQPVRGAREPLLVLPDDVPAHPYAVAM